MRVYLIRHGATKGNKERRYVGTTDERLLFETVTTLREDRSVALRHLIGDVIRVYVSPLIRCRETAEILFPYAEQIVIEGFRECDFGKFEYKNCGELNGDSEYQYFIDSCGKDGFPEGETRDAFQARCVESFREIVKLAHISSEDAYMVLVVHGGTIMSILDRYAQPHREYYDWQAENGYGFSACLEINHDGEICLRDVEAI